MSSPSSRSLPLLNAATFPLESFVQTFLIANEPCLIQGFQDTHFHFTSTNWRDSRTGEIDLDKLQSLYANEIVTVADCNIKSGYDQKRTEMKVRHSFGGPNKQTKVNSAPSSFQTMYHIGNDIN